MLCSVQTRVQLLQTAAVVVPGGCHLRVMLYHNEDAGEGASAHDLTATIERHGHTVVAVVGTSDDATRILEAESDLVVASGGDGTVSTAARVLAGKATPMAILPNGTANNLARSMNITGTTDEIRGRMGHGHAPALRSGSRLRSVGRAMVHRKRRRRPHRPQHQGVRESATGTGPTQARGTDRRRAHAFRGAVESRGRAVEDDSGRCFGVRRIPAGGRAQHPVHRPQPRIVPARGS